MLWNTESFQYNGFILIQWFRKLRFLHHWQRFTDHDIDDLYLTDKQEVGREEGRPASKDHGLGLDPGLGPSKCLPSGVYCTQNLCFNMWTSLETYIEREYRIWPTTFQSKKNPLISWAGTWTKKSDLLENSKLNLHLVEVLMQLKIGWV